MRIMGAEVGIWECIVPQDGCEGCEEGIEE